MLWIITVFFSVGAAANVAQGLLINEIARSHRTMHRSQ